MLLGVALYAFTANQVSSREADAVEARQAADAAEAEAGALAPFGDFRQVKDTRVEAVRTLAEGRLDWERLTRELAYVLPRGVRLDSVEGSTTGESADSGGSSASAPAPAPPPESSAPASDDSTGAAPATPTADATGGPTVVLAGCAESQRTVAKAVVRLRRLNGAQDVTLQDSSAAETGGATSDGGTAAGCPAFTFNATVQLAPATTTTSGLEAKAVPAGLGGGV